MKESNKSSIITGIVLLALASLFSVSLLVLPLDFGLAGPSHDNFFYKIGSVLFSVYGYSSIFIPVFLLAAGITSFATKWTARKTMRLITALVPFFTCVITENLCRSLIENGSKEFLGVKLSVIIITGVMLIIIEYLGAGILADKINNKTRKAKVSTDKDGFTKIDKFKVNGFEITSDAKPSSSSQAVFEDIKLTDEDKEEETEETIEEKIDPKKLAIFDDIFPIPNETIPQSFDDLGTPDLAEEEKISTTELEQLEEVEELSPLSDSNEEDKTISEEISEIEELEDDEEIEDLTSYAELEELTSENPEEATKKLDKELEELIQEEENLKAQSEAKAEMGESVATVKVDSEEKEEDTPINSASVITQEEFEALTNISSDEENMEPADELEWPNLAPAVDKLPPEYDPSFDENDPDLEFPPKENIKEVKENEEEEEIEDFTELSFDNEANTIEFDSEEENDEEDYSNHDDIPFMLDEEDEEEDDQDPVLEYETEPLEDDDFDNEKAPVKEYDDSIHENPNFSHGIVIRDKNYVKEEKEDNQNNTKPTPKPKYPRTINLSENVNVIEDEDDDFEEDVTLPFPKFDVEEPAITSLKEKNEEAITKDDDFDVLDSHLEEEQEVEEIEDLDDEDDEVLSSMNNLTSMLEDENVEVSIPTKTSSESKIFKSGASVFSDMEEDIRKAKGLDEDNIEDTISLDDDFEDEDEVEEVEVIKEEKKDIKSSVTSTIPASKNQIDKAFQAQFGEKEIAVNNLTADELSDFFDAQQEENTPKTEEIAGNPKQIGNRAVKKGPYVIPSDLLTAYKDDQYWIIDEGTKKAAMNLKQTLAEFNIEASITGIKKGPVVTMFEILPAPGVRLNKIVALQDNIALSLAAQSVRIVAPIPGKQAVGIEVPNKNRSVVGFREIIEMDLPEWKKMRVPVILGKDILGKAQLIDLVKTPHMLIAGATGSGKSVCVNSLILSILYKRSYKDVKLILIDPKVVELKLYNDIPHLLTPVITEPKKALRALQYCLCEMERRYALLDSMGVRDIGNYNQKIKEQNICTEKLPYIVVIIDEFADLMATSGKELENIVARLTAMSRAVGIHLVLATQRPSVNVITGLIKANIPTRIAFMVASRTDSNIIIDTVGAEKLLGRGDMLYASAVDPAPIRIQGTFVNDQEVENVVNAVKEYGEPDYLDESLFEDDEDEKGVDLFGEPMSDDDPLYDQALEIVVQAGKASASFIQRRLKIGYNRAARLVEEMEERGIVGPANGSKPREIIHVP